MRAYDAADATLQSFHWESPANEHQSYFVGNQNLSAANANIDRRSYFSFDVGSISQATDATLRFWAWQSATANNNSGAFTSSDPTETMEFYSVDSFTASDVINAPFNATTDHTLDVPIWTDLGDGTLLGSRLFSEADETSDLIPSPTTDPTIICGGANTACGKWLGNPPQRRRSGSDQRSQR